MSWRARERRRFRRLVNRLKAAPIYHLGSYTIVDADIIFLRKRYGTLLSESQALRQASFLSYLNSGAIKTDNDFDAIFNPSLTLEVSFGTSRSAIKKAVCEALDEIAASWKSRLVEQGSKDIRLFRYYDGDADEWTLEFMNTDIPVNTIRDSCSDVKFFIPEL